MRIRQLSATAVALSTLAIAGCADAPAPTAPGAAASEPISVTAAPTAWLPSGDPNAIPVGTPGRIEFLGRTRASRQTLVFPLGAPPPDLERVAQSVREWVAQQKVQGSSRDASTAAKLRYVEQLLAARTPDELRAALGPRRERVHAAYSVHEIRPGLFEHAATYGLDGRDALRVVTNAKAYERRPAFYCVDDPTGYEFDPNCPPPGDYYDPSFDPAQVAADLAVMQADVDGMAAQEWSIEAQTGGVDECVAERKAFVTASLAFLWATGEAVYYAWRRDIPNTYKYVKVAVIAYGAADVAHDKYMACVGTTGRVRL